MNKVHIIVPFWFGLRQYHVEVSGDNARKAAREHIREANLSWRQYWWQIHLPRKPDWWDADEQARGVAGLSL